MEDSSPIEAWNMMGSQIDWSALPVIVELLHIDDVPLFIQQLIAIGDHVRLIQEVERGK